MNAAGWGMTGFGLGAGMMYWMDPRSGRRRRALLEDKAQHTAREATALVSKARRDLSHRAEGWRARVAGILQAEATSDRTLEARARSALGRVCSHPRAIDIRIEQGHATLRGAILHDEHAAVVRRMMRVPGIRQVIDELEPHAPDERHPALQGTPAIRNGRARPLDRNLKPLGRLTVGAGGAALLGYGLVHRGIMGPVFTLSGLALALRSLIPVQLQHLQEDGTLAIIVQKDLTVDAPVEEVYAFWSALENFPRFMRHVKEVRWLSEDTTRWRIEGPAGVSFQWTATVTENIPNALLAWKSDEPSRVGNAGRVRFEPLGDRKTRLDIRLSYHPPAGALGHVFAKLLGVDPKKEMDEDLLRFKSLLETGKATGNDGTVRVEELRPSLHPV